MLLSHEPLSPDDARRLSPLSLACVGDAVWSSLVRTHLLLRNKNVHHIHTGAVLFVSAKAQAACLRAIQDALTADELALVHRGRNAHSRHPVPKNPDPEDYAAATGFETLVGYLYITGMDERIRRLFDIIVRMPEYQEYQSEG